MHEHHVLGDGRQIVEGKTVDDQIPGIERNSHRGLWQRFDQLTEASQRFGSGLDSEHRTDMVRVLSQVREDTPECLAAG